MGSLEDLLIQKSCKGRELPQNLRNQIKNVNRDHEKKELNRRKMQLGTEKRKKAKLNPSPIDLVSDLPRNKSLSPLNSPSATSFSSPKSKSPNKPHKRNINFNLPSLTRKVTTDFTSQIAKLHPQFAQLAQD